MSVSGTHHSCMNMKVVEIVAWRTLGLELTKCQTNWCQVSSTYVKPTWWFEEGFQTIRR